MKRIIITQEHLNDCQRKHDPQSKFNYPTLQLAIQSKCLATAKFPLQPGNKIFILINRRWFAIGSLGFCKKLHQLTESPLHSTMCRIAASIGLNRFAEIANHDKTLKPNKLHFWARSEQNIIPYGKKQIITPTLTHSLFKTIFNSPATCWLVPFEPTPESQFSPTPNQNVFLVRPSTKLPNQTIPVELITHRCQQDQINPDHFGIILEKITELNKRQCRMSTLYAIWKDPNSASYCIISEWVKQEQKMFEHPLIVLNGFDAMVQLVVLSGLAVPMLDWSHFASLKSQEEVILNLGCLPFHEFVLATPQSIYKMFESFVQSICSVSSISFGVFKEVWGKYVVEELRGLLESNRVFEGSLLCMSGLKMMSWVGKENSQIELERWKLQ